MANYSYSPNVTRGALPPRKALYFDYSYDRSLSDIDIRLDNWAIERVTSAPRARSRLHHNDFLVGLVHLEHLDDEQIEDIESFFRDEDSTAWIALTCQEDLKNPVFRRLIYQYFYDYFTLPLENSLDYLKATLGHAYGKCMLKDRVTTTPQSATDDEIEIVGTSPSMLKVFEQIRHIAGVDAPVLLYGETGTGKELVASAIHQRSHRSTGPFQVMNSAALPESLLEAELFGAEESESSPPIGRTGRLESARGGTVFIKELTRLPVTTQRKLLQALEQNSFMREGSRISHPLDVRILAGTAADVEKAISEGRLINELYQRLSVLSISVPSLADREQDIELLARYFFNRFKDEYDTPASGFSPESIDAMLKHRWSGNVREMINKIRRALVMAQSEMIQPQDLALSPSDIEMEVISLDEARNQAEMMAVKCSLQHTHHNISKAAGLLGVSRVTLYRLMDKYAIR